MKEPGRKIASLRILPPGFSLYMPDMACAPLPRPYLHVILYPDSFFWGGYHALTLLCDKSISPAILCIYRHGGNVIIPLQGVGEGFEVFAGSIPPHSFLCLGSSI